MNGCAYTRGGEGARLAGGTMRGVVDEKTAAHRE